jgi:hypothetical protein
VIILVAALHRVFGNGDSFPVPSETTLAGLSMPQRIVALAESQVGYSTEPSSSYCNKYSAYWGAGTADCPSGETAGEWCADFAAWAWQKAGVQFTYGYGPGEISGARRQLLRVGRRQRRVAPGDERIRGRTWGLRIHETITRAM